MGENTQNRRYEKTETEIGVMLPQANGHLDQSRARRDSKKEWLCQHRDLALLTSRTLREHISVILSDQSICIHI